MEILQVCFDTKKEWFMQKTSCSQTTVFALLFFVVGVGMSFAAWDGSSTKKPATEKIGSKDFFLIENEANLAWFRDSVNAVKGNSTLNAKLMASLDMGGKLFVPIAAGSSEITFGGIFDGNGFTISNLYMNSDELGKIPNEFCPSGKPMCNAQNVGFIGVLGGGTVKNLNLENVDISASTNKGVSGGKDNPVSVGPVVGYQRNGTIENCYVSGNILTSGMGNSVGGIVGNSWSNEIKNSLSTITILVSGDSSAVGGIVGSIRDGGSYNEVTIDACAYDGNIILNSGNGTAGGVVGYYERGNLKVSRSYFDTDIIDRGLGLQADGLAMDGTISAVKNVNSSKVVCDLNDGEMKNNSCSKTGAWSVGDVHIVLNGTTRDNNDELTYGIYFDANGGQFVAGSKTVKYLRAGEMITADEISAPVRGDTVFGGWALTPDATGPEKDLGKVVSSTTVYAYWKPMFEITFDANGGTFPDNATTKTKNVADGLDIDMDGIDLPTTYTAEEKTYYFAGWAATADATEALASLGTASKKNTFYAVWTEAPTFAVIFDTQGYGKTFVLVQEGGKASKPTDPSVEGYTFGGWFTDKDCKTVFDFTAAVTENKVAYAKWSLAEFKITYELDGGVNNKSNPESYTIESETVKLAVPTKVGFTFDGWYYDKKFSNAASQISKGSTGDKKFYAKWKVRTYSIVYMAGTYGREVVPADVKTFNEPITLKEASYTRDGYVQKGWATENGGKKKYELGATYSVNARLTLYPYWEKASGSDAIRNVATNRLTFSVAVQNRTLDISGTKPGAVWAVFDMQGGLVARGIVGSSSSRVEIQQAGSYIVRMDSQFRTVRIR